MARHLTWSYNRPRKQYKTRVARTHTAGRLGLAPMRRLFDYRSRLACRSAGSVYWLRLPRAIRASADGRGDRRGISDTTEVPAAQAEAVH